MTWVALSIGLLVLGVSWLRYRDPLYPPVVMSAVWCAVIAAAGGWPGLVRVPDATLLLAGVGTATFAAGAYLATWDVAYADVHAAPPAAPPARWAARTLFGVALLGLPAFVAKAQALAATGPTDSFLVNVRLAVTGDVFTGIEATGSFGLVAYLVPVAIVAAMLQLARDDASRGATSVAVALAATYAILTTGRTFVILTLLAVAVPAIVRGRIPRVRALALFGAVVVAAFVAVGWALGKVGDEGVPIADVVAAYTVSTIPAFGQVADTSMAGGIGQHVFRTPLAVLGAVGVGVPVPSLVQPPAYVPMPTNVYTLYQPYFLDFGWIGAYAVQPVLGVLHGLLYRGAVRRGGAWAMAFSLSLYPLLLQFFQDQYLSLLSTWVQFGVLIALGFWRPGIVPRAVAAEAAR